MLVMTRHGWRIIRRQIPLVIAIGIVASILGFILRTPLQWYQFDKLEQNAKKAISANELQTWAVKVLGESSTYSVSQFWELRTNYPAKLRGLIIGIEPSVHIIPGSANNAIENRTSNPPAVSLVWGSGFLGHRGFESGPTNFVSPRGSAWSPGVYFFRW
jgi:hypothetical protein